MYIVYAMNFNQLVNIVEMVNFAMSLQTQWCCNIEQEILSSIVNATWRKLNWIGYLSILFFNFTIASQCIRL